MPLITTSHIYLLPAPTPWPYIADFTRPEGHTHLACPDLPDSNMVRKIFFYRLPAALRLPTSHQELGNYTSRLILSFLRFLARWPGWYGIAVLPCFSASGKVPVTRCGLPLRGTYAAYCPSSRLDCHTLPATTLRKVAAPIPSGQTGLDASRQAQFSAGIVISM
jgi:hypothetical protein|nr:MAG TPA: hypothetical protein [Caudoviricetes sp.]